MAYRRNNDNNTPAAIALRETPQAPRLPMPSGAFSGELGISMSKWKLLTDTVYPSAKTVDGILQAVAYCNERGFDVMKRPVHVVPMWSTALNREVETIWPGIGELRTTAARTGQWAGIDDVVFGPSRTQAFRDKQSRGNGDNKYVIEDQCDAFEFPLWAQVTVYKMVAGQRVMFVGPKVMFSEAYSGSKGLKVPNAMWQRRPCGQLEKCAEAAALRRAFPEEIGEQYAAEEMEGKVMMGHNSAGADMTADVQRSARGAPTRQTMDVQADPVADDARRVVAEQRAKDESFVAATKNGLARETTLEKVERAAKVDEQRIASLPHDLRGEVDAAYQAARDRLKPGLTPEEVSAYQFELVKRIDATPNIAALVALEEGEAANFDKLPHDDRQAMFKAIDARKESFMGSTEGGAAAPTADMEQQQTETE